MSNVTFRSLGRANYNFFVRGRQVTVINGYTNVSHPLVVAALAASKTFERLTDEEVEAIRKSRTPQISPAASALIAGLKPAVTKGATHTDETPPPAPAPKTAATGVAASDKVAAIAASATSGSK